MKKTYILDTNILLKSPTSILGFEDNNVCITDVTVEELDCKKNDLNREVGYNARQAINILKSLRNGGNLMDGVSLPGGGIFKIISLEDDSLFKTLPKGWKPEKPDNLMLLTVENYINNLKTKEECIFITNDGNLQVKADCRGIKVQDYNNERIADNIDIYSGRAEYYVMDEVIDHIYQRDEPIEADKIDFYDYETHESVFPVVYENQFIVLHSFLKTKSILLKYKQGKFYKLDYFSAIEDITPLNNGQRFALEALLAPASEIPLVILQGPAGTAKTFLSLAAGLEKTMGDRPEYKRILICRPNSKFDDDIGFLKGDEMAKIGPLIRPFYDNLESLLELQGCSFEETPSIIDSYFEEGFIKAEAMAYMRGRSITNTFIIVDEAQNATPNQILGMITRAGKGSKIVIAGDPNQIDEVKLDKRNNGLVFACEKMKESPLCASVTFKEDECKRSELAKEAAKLLTNSFSIV